MALPVPQKKDMPLEFPMIFGFFASNVSVLGRWGRGS
jgi:hypothetical protein